MKNIIAILTVLLSTLYVSSTNADEPKASSPTPRVNNVWGAKNEWINNHRQNQARQAQQARQSQQFINNLGWSQIYRSPQLNQYYYRPVIFYRHGYPMYYQQRVHIRCNNNNGHGVALFFMNVR